MSNLQYIQRENLYVQKFMAAASENGQNAVLAQLAKDKQTLGDRLLGRPVSTIDRDDIVKLKICEIAAAVLHATPGMLAQRDFDSKLGKLMSDGVSPAHGGFTLSTQLAKHLDAYESGQAKPSRGDGAAFTIRLG